MSNKMNPFNHKTVVAYCELGLCAFAGFQLLKLARDWVVAGVASLKNKVNKKK